jgi:hypothetical protein
MSNKHIFEMKKKTPIIIWLKVTDYMHGWLDYEYAGTLHVHGKPIITMFCHDEIRDILKKEVIMLWNMEEKMGNSVPSVQMAIFENALDINEEKCREVYGFTRELMNSYIPFECPRQCLTRYGVLRPWGINVNLKPKQAIAIQKFIRQEFWEAVAEFDEKYKKKMDGKKYPAVAMIEDFCRMTHTPDKYVEAIRREWQRQAKKKKTAAEISA